MTRRARRTASVALPSSWIRLKSARASVLSTRWWGAIDTMVASRSRPTISVAAGSVAVRMATPAASRCRGCTRSRAGR